ncbi:hypothetical protein G3O06_05585 [Burkholderia sp. Ac-20345]|uniref:hypothetical protein n=1 Tax=Burkholderia sp. Ac-20345 TaxID=2703891 RepID=UPI00197C9238|nr:hypothetical protein [Burkholderia sp. Ac-20345]MBN3777039.1 hypothetical protein [Burkholderia sp. Ac-20345]
MLKFAISPIVAISFAAASMLAGGNAFAQQADQQEMLGVTGTVVRVRLVPTPIPQGNRVVQAASAQDLVEVSVRASDGELYSASADCLHQPRLGASVRLVSFGNGLRVAE